MEFDWTELPESSPEADTLDPSKKEVAAAWAAAATLPVVDLLIARDILSEKHLVIPDRRAFVEVQTRDADQQLLRSWRKRLRGPTPDEIAAKSNRVKTFA